MGAASIASPQWVGVSKGPSLPESRNPPGRRTPRKPADPVRGRRDSAAAERDLPRWVVEALTRVTPNDRVEAALRELSDASKALSEGRFGAALRRATKAKGLSPRDATVREVLGIAAYRLGEWATALRELRTYRRLAGEGTHVPVEMDVLRALGRPKDVERLWSEVESLTDSDAVLKETLVVYASFLLDETRIAEARALATPDVVSSRPYAEDLRVWYVAARSAALDGDRDQAVELRDAILSFDPSFPGIAALDAAIASNA